MTSGEIKNKINELTAALADFESQVNKVVSKYHAAAAKTSSINSSISGHQDTLIIKAISNTNSSVTAKIDSLIGSIESSRAAVVSKIKDKIADLERELRIALAAEELAMKRNSKNSINQVK